MAITHAPYLQFACGFDVCFSLCCDLLCVRTWAHGPCMQKALTTATALAERLPAAC